MDADLTFDPLESLLPGALPEADGAFEPGAGELHFPLPPVKPLAPGEPQRTYVLTPRQDAFARHYVACGNGAEAARRAGYSHKNARYLARDNLRHTQVRWRIRDLVAARTRRRASTSTSTARHSPGGCFFACCRIAFSACFRPPTALSASSASPMTAA